ncbi:MAG: short-chain dehydrogenase, partial [Pedobacter sp.]
MNIIITGASSGIGFETALEFSLQKENKIVAIA